MQIAAPLLLKCHSASLGSVSRAATPHTITGQRCRTAHRSPGDVSVSRQFQNAELFGQETAIAFSMESLVHS